MSQRLRVFISSPGDVPDERLRADLVIDKLAQDYSRFFSIESYRWEHEPMLASGHFQDAIDPPSAFDIVVLILWSRLGTPLPTRTETREYKGIDGRAPVTGTEWEYEEALKAAREKGAPDILAFRNISPASVDLLDRDARERSFAQFEALDAFWKRHFADRGVFLAAYDEYHSLEEFAQRLESSLRKLIERKVAALTASAVTPEGPIWAGAPFRGLAAYEFEHAAIFFGRDGAVAKAAEQLSARARNGTAFLLISGPSGSGKSSLVKAALVPRLMKPQRISGIAFLRRLVFRPSDGGHDPILGLVETLTRAAGTDGIGLPELLAPGQTAEQLAAHLRIALDAPGFVFASALGRLTADGRRDGHLLAYEDAKLILVVDQLEELFTVSGLSPENQRNFLRLLGGLARSGGVWVVATIRSDFWHRLAEIPEMIALSEGIGRLDLAAPSPAELAEMIRKPAQAAGLAFEIHPETGIGLDAVLAQHAASEPGVLPLLSFTLDELYRGDVKERNGRVLTYATYDALGGLEGAIATRADQLVATFDEAEQAALPQVLRRLATVSADGDHVTVARTAPLASFPPGSPARAIVDRLTAARLLVASGEGSMPTVRLAHEALISRWGRARQQLATDRRDLETREQIERQCARWRQQTGRAQKQLLLRDPDLANAIDLEKRWGDELDAPLRGYIHASHRRARLRQQLTAVAAVLFALVAIGAGWAQHQASIQRDRASANELQANQARDRAVATQSRLLAERASRLTDQGDTLTAILLALEGFRGPEWNSPERYEPAAEKSLADALYQHRLRAIISDPKVKYVDAAFTSDGSMLAVVDGDGGVSFRSLNDDGGITGRADLTVKLTAPVKKVVAVAHQPILVFHLADKTYVGWNYRMHQTVPGLRGTCDDPDSTIMKSDPAGTRLIVFCDAVHIYDLKTNQTIDKPGPYSKFAFAGNGTRFATMRSDSTVEVWNAQNGRLIKSWKAPDAQGFAMSFDGETVMTTTYEGVRFWKSATGARQKADLRSSQARTFDVYASPANDIFVTDGDDGSQVWSANRDAAIQQVAGTTQFLPNGMLAVKDGQNITLWEYVIEGHMGTYEAVQRGILHADLEQEIVDISPDSKRLITATGDGRLYVWRTDAPMMLQANDAIEGSLISPRISGDGKTIAAANKSSLMFWNADTLKESRHIDLPGEPQILALLPSHAADRVLLQYLPKEASNKSTPSFQVMDVASGKSLFPGSGLQSAAVDFSDDGKFVVGVDGRDVIRWSVDEGRSQKCSLPDKAIDVAFGSSSSVVYVAGHNLVVHSVDFSNCAATDVLSFSEQQAPSLSLTYRHGLLLARVNWRDENARDDSFHLKLWSEARHAIVFDTSKPEWDNIDFLAAGDRVLLSRIDDKSMLLFDALPQQNVLRFEVDWNDCCDSSGFGFFPDGRRLFTSWSERGASRLRTWRIFPDIAGLEHQAQTLVPECLSPRKRNILGLDAVPPRWCIDLGKPPYDTKDWRDWLSSKSAGLDPPLPVSAEWTDWRAQHASN